MSAATTHEIVDLAQRFDEDDGELSDAVLDRVVALIVAVEDPILNLRAGRP